MIRVQEEHELTRRHTERVIDVSSLRVRVVGAGDVLRAQPRGDHPQFRSATVVEEVRRMRDPDRAAAGERRFENVA